ncbi:DUF4365 domain-containing protein [Empedobacter brevis]|uniref:DUF4365 domain-containing protein n=1 Tax=Empedobacter brevis TaxID=247 RepID=UPI002897F59D|nr:DUF4365 domain-containing protein [Empedobacter brevis]
MKYNNTYIQSEADELLRKTLRNLFISKNYQLAEFETNQKYEKGIDYFFEVFNDKNEHILLFLNQNKGTIDNLKFISKIDDINFGKISFQISIRHAEYFYYELNEPLIFTICDLNTKTVYWYDIQNDFNLKERISIQKTKKN